MKQSLDAELMSFGIEALEFYLSSFTFQNMKAFFKLDSIEDIEALKENFVINVEGMLKALRKHQTDKLNHEF